MARPVSIDSEQLIERLSCVFRTVGYEGASLAMLAKATGLQKASLYHRFPGGKEQMAQEVLGAAATWLAENLLRPLRSDKPPAVRLNDMCGALSTFYEEGRQSCLLNVLSSPHDEAGPFDTPIKEMFEAFISALAGVLKDAGVGARDARARAQFAIGQLQGSLVLCRAMNTTRPFKDCLTWIRTQLITQHSI